ncbi:MAG: Undecaprenyl-phosphate galactose phosphotransferase [Candidatus Eremiobacteraeota bacterium]|nr:Undecaprenyl-phosphate galactose phosphotransferase [Candidatus Eremiobacteraeota bacterium]
MDKRLKTRVARAIPAQDHVGSNGPPVRAYVTLPGPRYPHHLNHTLRRFEDLQLLTELRPPRPGLAARPDPAETPIASAHPRVERRLRSRRPVIYRHSRRVHLLRRIRDVVLASAALLVASPVLALAALAIVVEDGGPIIFTQRRVGHYERLFTIFKLRTMRLAECGDHTSPSGAGDGRITRVGRFLRKSSIDELPQLINVIRGDMTLVGPRPEMPFIVRNYRRFQHVRHVTPPGLTGLWQIMARSTIPLAHPAATAMDIEYLHRSSPSFDAALLFGTVPAVIRKKGAY